MQNNLENRRMRKINLPLYMVELETLLEKKISEEELSSLDDVEELREKSKKELSNKRMTYSIFFEEKSTNKFLAFIEELHNLNQSSVVIWTERTNTCGYFTVKDIREINFNFPYDLNSEGVLEIMTIYCNDMILFDFFEKDDRKCLEINVQGRNWTKAQMMLDRYCQ